MVKDKYVPGTHYELYWNGYPWGNMWLTKYDVKREMDRLDKEYGAGKYKIVKVVTTKEEISL